MEVSISWEILSVARLLLKLWYVTCLNDHQYFHNLFQLSSIELTHKLFSGPSEWIPAMNKVKQIVAEANFSNRAFPVATEYASWETDEVG